MATVYDICKEEIFPTARDFIVISINTLAMILVTVIAIFSINPIYKMQKLNYKLKLLYISSIFCPPILIPCTILTVVLCHFYSAAISVISISIGFTAYYIMLLNLLGTLITRLYITFNESMYRIPSWKRIIINSLFTFTVLITISVIGTHASIIFVQHQTQNSHTHGLTKQSSERLEITIKLAQIGFAVYIITAAFTVSLFAQNMLKLTNLRATSLKNVFVSVSSPGIQSIDTMESMEIDVKLNKTQTKLINNISKYVSLFSVGLISTLLTMFWIALPAFAPTEWKIDYYRATGLAGAVDTTINLICLALQYPFADAFYRKYCKWIECCWKMIFIRRTHKSLIKKYELAIQSRKSTLSTPTNNHITNNKENNGDTNNEHKHEECTMDLHIPQERKRETDGLDTKVMTTPKMNELNVDGNRTVTYSLSPNAHETLNEIMVDVLGSDQGTTT